MSAAWSACMPETAVIAGHGPGFCEEFAKKLAEAGFSVALFARSERYLSEFTSELRDAGYEVRGIPVDLTEPEQVTDGFRRVREEIGPVEAVAHTASFHDETDTNLDPAQFEKNWRVYTFSVLLCFREAVDDLCALDGTFLCFGAAPEIGDTYYKSAKAGTRGLARALDSEYRSDGVQVTHVVVAGSILNPDKYERKDEVVEAEHIDPAEMAETCLHLVEQPPRSRTFELDVHTFGRRFR